MLFVSCVSLNCNRHALEFLDKLFQAAIKFLA